MRLKPESVDSKTDVEPPKVETLTRKHGDQTGPCIGLQELHVTVFLSRLLAIRVEEPIEVKLNS
jgi:hypothetical protein